MTDKKRINSTPSLPSAVAPTGGADIDIRLDREFIAGAQFGWNCGVADASEHRDPRGASQVQRPARDKFQAAIRGRYEQIHAARAAIPVAAPENEQRFALSGQCDNAAHSRCPYPEKCKCPCHVAATQSSEAAALTAARAIVDYLALPDSAEPEDSDGSPTNYIAKIILKHLRAAAVPVGQHPLIPEHGIQESEESWQQYQRNIEEYRAQINEMESESVASAVAEDGTTNTPAEPQVEVNQT